MVHHHTLKHHFRISCWPKNLSPLILTMLLFELATISQRCETRIVSLREPSVNSVTMKQPVRVMIRWQFPSDFPGEIHLAENQDKAYNRTQKKCRTRCLHHDTFGLCKMKIADSVISALFFVMNSTVGFHLWDHVTLALTFTDHAPFEHIKCIELRRLEAFTNW